MVSWSDGSSAKVQHVEGITLDRKKEGKDLYKFLYS